MAYFPAFLKFDDKSILIVGGGYVALEKLEHLLNFSSKITLIARDFSDKVKALIDENSLEFFKKDYEIGDAKGFDIVIAAIDDFALQESIYFETRNYNNTLCNCVDLQKYCDFIFPAYIKKGDLTIAISTGGSSPAFAKNFKEYLKNSRRYGLMGSFEISRIDGFYPLDMDYVVAQENGLCRSLVLEKNISEIKSNI